jgi:hypothetical protein
MSQLVDYVDELIQEVGPRPTGTQQEHQAAELIASQLDGFGLSVEIEEFSCSRHASWVRTMYYALSVAGAALLFVLPGLRASGAVIIIGAMIFMILDLLGKSPFYAFFRNSLSQNVIAKHIPQGLEPSARNRRVVILAHYDSTRTMVQAAPPIASKFELLRTITRGAMIGLAVLSLLLLIPFPAILKTILLVITAAAGLAVLVALIVELINFVMPYNDGANCNGSGVSVLFGLAEELTSGGDSRQARAAARRRSSRAGGGRSGRASSRGERTERGERAERGERGERTERVERIERTNPVADEVDSRVTQRATRTQNETAALGEVGVQEGLTGQLSGSLVVPSVGDNLVNPFLKQRPPLAEIEEANRLREEEHARQLAEQRKQQEAEQEQNDAGVPAWFAAAKKNAEKSAERKQRGEDETDIVRSRFADVPTVGSPGVASVASTAVKMAGEARRAAALGGAAEETVAQVASTSPAKAGSVSYGRAIPKVSEPDRTGAIVASSTSLVDVDIERAQAQAVSQQTATREFGTVTAEPDFTGLDKQAFKVLPGDENKHAAVIVPSEQGERVVVAPTREAVVVERPATTAAAVTATAVPAAPTSPVAPVAPTPPAPSTATIAAQQVPSFDFDELVHEDEAPAPEQQRLRSRLRDLPTVSAENTGNFPAQQLGLDLSYATQGELFPEEDHNSVISSAGSFLPLGTTGVMKPLGEELLDYHDANDSFIQDADDAFVPLRNSDIAGHAAPEIVNIPESRVKSFLGSVGDRLSGKKREKLDDSPTNWLGVDDDYDARKEGRDIGSWSNFHDEDDDGWAGGAYGGSYDENVDAVMNLSKELLDKEVWLVALGANESMNAGIKNLFANHESELKSALFINLEGVGAGDLVFTIAEGDFRPTQTDHRLQDLIARAAQNMAIPIAPVTFSAFETDCGETLNRGGRAISIMGLGENLPVGWRWATDNASRLREDNLQDVTALVLETIKNS